MLDYYVAEKHCHQLLTFKLCAIAGYSLTADAHFLQSYLAAYVCL